MLPVYTAMGTAGVAAVALAVSGMVAVSVVPVAMFGPLALAYEPIRRAKKSLRGKPNRFGVAAASGLAITSTVIDLLIMSGYESP